MLSRDGKTLPKLFEFRGYILRIVLTWTWQAENFGGIFHSVYQEHHAEDQAMQLMLAAVATSCALAVGTMTAASEPPGFTAVPVLGTAPLTVRFSVGGRPGRYKIDFGDGTSQASLDTVLSQPWITHAYTVPGTYTATLLATADSGADVDPQASLAIVVTGFP